MSYKPTGRPVGRPAIPDELKRNQILTASFTRNEAEAVRNAAAERGISVTAYLAGLVAADNAAARTENA